MPDRRDDEDDETPEEEIQRILRQILSGETPEGLPPGFAIDPAQFAQAAGLPSDPAVLQSLFAGLQQAMKHADGNIDWTVAKRTALDVAKQHSKTPTSEMRSSVDRDFGVASLWLSEVTTIGETSEMPRAISRVEWVHESIETWTSLAEPVALSISDALMTAVGEHSPEELKEALAGAGKMIRGVAGALFAMQLGTVVGRLSTEVLSAGDVGIPLFTREIPALLPENVATFGAGLDQPLDQVQLYLAVRELAHARLFHHARWLRLHIFSAINDYAKGIHIDVDRIEQLAAEFDPSNPEEIRLALTNGSLIPPKNDEQLAAHARLETVLALVEGWVDEVTLEATKRLPGAQGIAEMVRRRRATGGPAESAFATLVGLELRPRRLREAAAMWAALTEAGGAEARDRVWGHPDLMPSSDEIDNPSLLVSRLGLDTSADEVPAESDFDRAIADLLNSDDSQRPREGAYGDILSEPSGEASGNDSPSSETGSATPDDSDRPDQPNGTYP